MKHFTSAVMAPEPMMEANMTMIDEDEEKALDNILKKEATALKMFAKMQAEGSLPGSTRAIGLTRSIDVPNIATARQS